MEHWLKRKARYYKFSKHKWWLTNESRFRQIMVGRYTAVAQGWPVGDPRLALHGCFINSKHHVESLDKGVGLTLFAIVGYLDEAARKAHGAAKGSDAAAGSVSQVRGPGLLECGPDPERTDGAGNVPSDTRE